MRLVHLIIDGFKTYGNRTDVTGFDNEFNAITGLNGQGKSNFLDAICFVLGISDLKRMRAEKLDDLIYMRGDAGVTKATVTLVFDNTDKSRVPALYQQFDQITVSRQIIKGGGNKYRINGVVVLPKKVQDLFSHVGLNVNNPNFLIMQGRIIKVLNMKPIETSGMIAEAAGTKYYENREKEVVKLIQKKDIKLVEIDRVMNDDIKPKLEQLQSDRARYVEFATLSNEVKAAQEISIAEDYHQKREAGNKALQARKDDDAEQQEITKRLKTAEATSKQFQRERDEELKRKEKEGGSQLRATEAVESERGEAFVKAAAKHEKLQERYQDDAKELKAGHVNVRELEASVAKAETAHAKAQSAVGKVRLAAEEADEAAAKAQGAFDASIGLANSEGKGATKNLPGQLSEVKEELAGRVDQLKGQEMKKKDVDKRITDTKKKLTEARKQGGKQEKEHAALVASVDKLRSKFTNCVNEDEREARLAQDLQEVQAKLAQLSKEEDGFASGLANVDFKIPDPKLRKHFEGRVKGTVAKNMRVSDERNATALEAVAGSRLHQVIVDNDKTGLDLLTRAKLPRRVTLIPLNKISKPAAEEKKMRDRVAEAQKLVGVARATLALDLVTFDADVKDAMSYVFGSTIVCADKDAARMICERLKLRTVTLEGDLFDSGTLTGGSRSRAGGSLLQRLSKFFQVSAEKAVHEQREAELSAELTDCRRAAELYREMASQLEVKEKELEIYANTMRSSLVGQLDAAMSKLMDERQALEESVKTLTGERDELEQRKADLASQIEDFDRNRDARIKEGKASAAAAAKEAQKAQKALQKEEASAKKVEAQLDSARDELAAAKKRVDELTKQQDEQVIALAKASEAEQSAKDAFEAAKEELEACKSALGKFDERIQQIEKRREEHEKKCKEDQENLATMKHREQELAKEAASAEKYCRQLRSVHTWIADEEHNFGVQGTRFDFAKARVSKQSLDKKAAQLEKLSKSVNKKALAQWESTEQDYNDLVAKKEQVQRDKDTFLATIAQLSQAKIETLKNTYAKVNEDFKSIFSTLLPGAMAKLDTVEGLSVEEGLEIKVGFGTEWKKSLSELSGGQRSLVALSLVLSLLRYKPAPLYILDEIDSALDPSHTQNIGTIIKTHFKEAQFLIVSLKPGMFSNANVIFRVVLDKATSRSSVYRSTPNVPGTSEQLASVELPAAQSAITAKSKKGNSSAATARQALSARN